MFSFSKLHPLIIIILLLLLFIIIVVDKYPVVICESCGEKSCYTHEVIWHMDQTCKEYEEQKKSSDFATGDYIKRNTKACPGCSMPIEKDQGCNHMTCTKCSYEFCWL